jgi:hypothetical protein
VVGELDAGMGGGSADELEKGSFFFFKKHAEILFFFRPHALRTTG